MSTTKAFQSGYRDGQDAVQTAQFQRTQDGETLTSVDVEAWFVPGQLDPDEGLINALGSDSKALRDALGLTSRQVKARGEAWHKALFQYNHGYRSGARAAIAE